MSVDRMLEGLVRLLLGFLSLLPLKFLRSLGRLIGWLNFAFDTDAAKITKLNLEICLPHLSNIERLKMTRASLMHTGQTATETPAVWLAPKSRTRDWIHQVENEHLLDDALALGNGVIVLLPHVGNWEVFNIYYATRGKMTALYHPPRQKFMKPIMEEVRAKLGNDLVPTNAKGIMRLYKCLQKGEATVVLPDQVPASGKFAPFFAEPALTDILISRMVKKTGATVVSCAVFRNTDGFIVRFDKPDDSLYSNDLQTSLEGLNQSIETCISPHLDQYQWEYKRFRERPPGQKKLYKFGDGSQFFH